MGRMIHPLSMFHDKNQDDAPWSMTRVVDFLFALAYLSALETFAFRGKEINWPFAALGVMVLLAVPVQALLSFLGQWIASREGRDLLTTAVHKIEESILNGPSTAPAPTPSVNVSVGGTPVQGAG